MPFGIPSSLRASRIGMLSVQEHVRALLGRRDETEPSDSLYSSTPILASNEQDQSTPKPALRSSRRHNLPGIRPGTDHPDLPTNLMPAQSRSARASSRRSDGWQREPVMPEDAVLPGRHPSDPLPVVGVNHTLQQEERDIESLERPSHGRHHERRKHRHHRHHQHKWVRKHGDRMSKRTCSALLHAPHTRVKCISTIVSGFFLALILGIYLGLAFTVHDLGGELHVLFIIIILGTLVLFLHSLIRLGVLARKGPRSHRSRRNVIPSIAGPEGFKPHVPIRVHLARDEEITAQGEDGTVDKEKMASVKAPPPAYGLWRGSVRVNPALLHWQRVNEPTTPQHQPGPPNPIPLAPLSSHPVNQHQPQQQGGYRPPSYMSDDGVEYVVSAAPRTTVYLPQPTDDVHPAYRECTV